MSDTLNISDRDKPGRLTVVGLEQGNTLLQNCSSKKKYTQQYASAQSTKKKRTTRITAWMSTEKRMIKERKTNQFAGVRPPLPETIEVKLMMTIWVFESLTIA
ncbi:hypothetical protein Y032_0013g2124 [Ancylostoma ceylanicum]|uniref:Uncharacterized protein n=1 Tax=Ancylostoma ceylanicum TaxID=53326 RepID=A0A016VC22_9BILA|nr:hypothetical protein Y032_0013g2124 [Ancylostoma ceylanicum]